MMYYTGAGPMIGHPNSFPRALPTGAGAAAQSHLPAGSILPAHSSVAAQVQQNSGLTNPQLYQMQLAGAAPHYPGLWRKIEHTQTSNTVNNALLTFWVEEANSWCSYSVQLLMLHYRQLVPRQTRWLQIDLRVGSQDEQVYSK